MKNLTEEEKQMLNDGVEEPDIVIEGKALAFIAIAVVCVVVLCAVVVGLAVLVEHAIRALC
jgi:flagellar basal body-associated protein FliL